MEIKKSHLYSWDMSNFHSLKVSCRIFCRNPMLRIAEYLSGLIWYSQTGNFLQIHIDHGFRRGHCGIPQIKLQIHTETRPSSVWNSIQTRGFVWSNVESSKSNCKLTKTRFSSVGNSKQNHTVPGVRRVHCGIPQKRIANANRIQIIFCRNFHTEPYRS